VRVLVEIDDERLEDVLTLPEGAPRPGNASLEVKALARARECE